MTLPAVPNREIPATLRNGDEGWPVYALQRMLSSSGDKLASDGDFGPKTELALEDAQERLHIEADGVAGPVTQRALCVEMARHVRIHGLPAGLLRSLIEGESGYYLGAVNWSVKGGVDCGVVQKRVLGPPYSSKLLMDAYDPYESSKASVMELDRRAEAFFTFPAVMKRRDRLEYSVRLGLLAHNWPWAANELARGRELSTSKRATWVPKGTKFPDGTPVISYSHWAQFYAMGGRHGAAKMTKYVRKWPS